MTKQRIERLRILMQENHLPALLVTNSFNRSYLSGFTGTSGYALITADKAILLTDFRYMTQAPQQVKHMDVLEHKANFMESVKEVLHDLNIQELGFEQHDVFYGAYSQYSMVLDAIKLVPTSYLVEQLRLYKDEHELAIMREAALLADRTFTHILPFLKPGVSELDIALEMEFFMRKNGAKSSSFDTIVASGERSALPHGVASERLLKSNEFVKLDFGAYYQGYCSDITRTVVLGK
ncbi:MAG: Xaa-Pro dipeptidase, partial [Paenibacillus sp. RIFOXYA1_FULL_44_5]